MAGFYAGYMDGLKTMSGLADQQAQTRLRDLQGQQAQLQLQEEKQTQATSKQVFQALRPGMDAAVQAGDDTALAKNYRMAATRLMGINPQEGMKLSQEADRIEAHAFTNQTNALKFEEGRRELTGQIFSGVHDQESLEQALPKLAKAGEKVPLKFQTWSPETAKYFEEGVRTSMKVKDQASVAARVKDAETREKTEQERERNDRLRNQTEKAKEARLQSLTTAKIRASGAKASNDIKVLSTPKDYENEMGILEGLSKEAGGAFASATPAEKRVASADVRFRARQYLQDSLSSDSELTPEQALAKAREDVLNEFHVKKEGGFFTKDQVERERKTGKEPPDPDVARIKDALKAKGESFDVEHFDYRIAPDGSVQRRRKG